MRILKVIGQHRNDFSAIMICEYCEHEQKLTSGYNDAYYHSVVIPKMRCELCDKSRNDIIDLKPLE